MKRTHLQVSLSSETTLCVCVTLLKAVSFKRKHVESESLNNLLFLSSESVRDACHALHGRSLKRTHMSIVWSVWEKSTLLSRSRAADVSTTVHFLSACFALGSFSLTRNEPLWPCRPCRPIHCQVVSVLEFLQEKNCLKFMCWYFRVYVAASSACQ